MVGGPIFGWCEVCRRWRWTISHAERNKVKLRLHHLWPPGTDLSDRSAFPVCPGSSTLVDALSTKRL